MKITFNDFWFEMEYGKYNLYREVPERTVAAGKNAGKVLKPKTEVIGYGLRIETVIERIAQYSLADKDVVITLGEYVTELNREKDAIRRTITDIS